MMASGRSHARAAGEGTGPVQDHGRDARSAGLPGVLLWSDPGPTGSTRTAPQATAEPVPPGTDRPGTADAPVADCRRPTLASGGIEGPPANRPAVLVRSGRFGVSRH